MQPKAKFTNPDERYRFGLENRREVLQKVGAAAALLWLGSWRNAVFARAADAKRGARSCIFIYFHGGASQLETFDPKPEHANGGPTRAIETAIPGIRFAEGWPKLAKIAGEVAVVRTLTGKEFEHDRAAHFIHTGYFPTGHVSYPSLGAATAWELRNSETELPPYICIGQRTSASGSGFLSGAVAPFYVSDPTRLPEDIALPKDVSAERLQRRLRLMNRLERERKGDSEVSTPCAREEQYARAARLILSPKLRAYNLDEEDARIRDRYGKTYMGNSCLLARRLIEEGVTFVEIESPGWDTHEDNFGRVKALSQTVDPAMAALIADLKERGLLGQTLVVAMGEFGQTPTINFRGGRDHFPTASSVLLAGGGIRGGVCVGSTSRDGMDIRERPVAIADLLQTCYRTLGIDSGKENASPGGRPIKLVDGGSAISELLG